MKKLIILFTIILPVSGILAQQDEPKPYLIKSIYFGGGSYYIDQDQVDELIEFIQGIPNINHHQISVHSHTDNIGGAAYNEWLSQMRSEAAIQQLILQKIQKEIISIQDFGQFNPIYDNETWEGRQKNRRVDIIIWPVIM